MEIFRVIKVENNTAYLEKIEKTDCESCPVKSFCKIEPKELLKIDVSGININTGDYVKVKTPKAVVTRLSFFVYTVPAILFIITALTMKFMNFSDIVSFIGSVAVMGLYFVMLKFLDSKLKEKFKPVVVEVLKNPPNTGGFHTRF